MSDFKNISSENKERLVGLVNKVAEYVKAGSHPTQALVKAASERECPPEFVLRAAEAYNGAAHLSYFKSASLEERGNSFPLADGQAALKQILSSTPDTTKKVGRDEFAYVKESCSYFCEVDSFEFAGEKKATAISFDEMQKNASVLDKQEKLAVELARNQYNSACEKLANDVKYFRERTASVSERRRSHWAREVIEKHGSACLDIVSLATNITGKDCTKLAEDRLGVFSLGSQEIDSLSSLVNTFNHVQNLHEKLAACEHDSYVNKVERDRLLNSAVTTKKSSKLDLVTGAPSFLATSMGTIEPGLDSEKKDIQSSSLSSLLDPGFLGESKRIERAILMNKLLKTDPIIAKQPASEIEKALKEVTSIAPVASDYEPLLRSMLRRRLEAGEQLDDFTLNQMMSMDDAVRERKSKMTVVPQIGALMERGEF
jgi:hypothetical protein